MTCREIIKKYLEDNGYDGLCNISTECGCSVSDLIPCGEYHGDCVPGYKQPDSWDYIGPEKPVEELPGQ